MADNQIAESQPLYKVILVDFHNVQYFYGKKNDQGWPKELKIGNVKAYMTK